MRRTDAAEKRPNILILYTDQQRFDTIAALGHPFIKTPSLDRLCAEGVALTHAFATCPVCMPSRSSLFSGTYTTMHQTYSNHHPGKRPETNLALELKKAGYRTALYGKNHCFLKRGVDIDTMNVGPKSAPDRARTGEQLQKWFQKAGATPSPAAAQGPDLEAKVGVYHSKISTRLRKASKNVETNEMHRQADACMDFIRACREDDRPFFTWMSWLYPHTPYEASDPFYSLYEGVELPPPAVEANGLEKAGKPFRQIFHQENNDRILPFAPAYVERMRRTYCAAISQIDFEVGRILDFLQAQGLRENTIIIFTSDHGDYQSDHGLMTKSPSLYDCLVRVPLICCWPGIWSTGVKSSELVSHVDLLPTLLSAAGLPVPGAAQGLDLRPLLSRGSVDRPLREAVFAEYGIPGTPFDRERLEKHYPEYRRKPIDVRGNGVPWEANPVSLAGRFRMVRTHEWKFIHEPGGTSELYHLKSDPHELVNLCGVEKYRTIQEALLTRLTSWKNALPGIERDQEDLASRFFAGASTKKNKRKNKHKDGM